MSSTGDVNATVLLAIRELGRPGVANVDEYFADFEQIVQAVGSGSAVERVVLSHGGRLLPERGDGRGSLLRAQPQRHLAIVMPSNVVEGASIDVASHCSGEF